MYDELVKRLREATGWKNASEHYSLMKQAADAIEELQQIAEHYEETAKDCFKDVCYYLERVPKWIPVTERLPKEGDFVLVYGDLYPNKHDGGVIAVSKRMDWNYWQGFGRERDITHWMPLPQPPKEE